jgi:hypothetical protein
MRNTRPVSGLIVTALLALAPAAMAWTLAVAHQEHLNAGRGYAVQFPAGWKYDRLWFSDETGATRDGPALQTIYVNFREHKNAFKALKKDSSPDMLPQELAELLVADMTKQRGLENVTIQSNEPAMLSGRPGFRLSFEYKHPVERGAVRVREIVVGASAPRGLYLIGYRAPVLYYFDRDVGSFADALSSFTIIDATAKPN